MSAELNFNTAAPVGGSLWRTVAIGWEHTIEDGEIVLTTDADGNPVPRTYRIPARLTTKQLLDATKGMTQAQLEEMTHSGLAGVIDMADVLLGGGIVETIGTDPTVPTDAFVTFLTTVLGDLNIGDISGSSGN